MKTVVLAFDIERTGAKPENSTIAIGLSVVDENLKELDSLLLKGYIPQTIPKDGTPPKGFEPRSWIEFWHDKTEKLKLFEVQGDFETAQKQMIIQFQEFRKKWELRAERENFTLEVCCDNPVYDGWFINDLICKYLSEYHPLPYMARKIKYKPLWDTDSMLRGVLAVVDPTFKEEWGLSQRVRELYDISNTLDVQYDHLPHHDAYAIACDAQIVLGIRENRIKLPKCCCCKIGQIQNNIDKKHWRCNAQQLDDMVTTIELNLEKHAEALWGGGIICRHMKKILERDYICDQSRGSWIRITGKKK